MDTNKALEHFKWKFENTWKPTEKDIEAFKSIIDYKKKQESYNLQQNESLAKLWIHQLILLSNTNAYSADRCIQIIDEILSKTTYEWCLKLKEELPMMRVRKKFGDYKTQEDMFVDFNYEISEDNFVEKEINRIINKFEK